MEQSSHKLLFKLAILRGLTLGRKASPRAVPLKVTAIPHSLKALFGCVGGLDLRPHATDLSSEGPALRQAAAQALATRQHMRDQAERTHAAFLQAEADRRAAGLS